ncbi:MAG TPA: 6-phospho-beta-glucosidase, partial [Acidobacteriota bacterium]|nr:6-phospho-beta-glucosidase [Acidobacteriota bacterium]
MKISVIGGGGARTPLLVRGLAESSLPLTEVSLFDIDQERLSLMGRVARELSDGLPVSLCSSSADCVEGANFIFTSIRVGGIDQRARDEETVLQHGLVGQETVGPGGYAMAMRTIPPMLEYAEQIARMAPRAWVINFTNPVGVITQAVQTATGIRIIGICDTPTELFGEVAAELGLPPNECFFDYFGLNHLGWLREVYHLGEPVLGRLWEDPARLRTLYRAPLFETDFLMKLQLLPSEYLYYYYRPEVAAANIRRAGISRGGVVAGLNAQLLQDLREPGAALVDVYTGYLDKRDASYLQIESGTQLNPKREGWAELTGYDRIALAVISAIQSNSGAILPLNVANNGNFGFLEDEDVVEVPCVVNG